MPTVETTVWIDKPLDKVYDVAKDNRSFPEFMNDVKSLTIIEEDGPRIVSDWVGLVPQFMLKIRWRQEDVWDDAAHTCTFKQLSGDYDKMDGVWRFIEEKGGTRFNSVVNYEYTVPTLGPLVKRVIHALVVKNLDGVLNSIKKRAESL
jgi:uncharacterized membrane protein